MYKQNDEMNYLSSCIENPIGLNVNNKIYGAKCSGCNSCGGGCYGCKVTDDLLESKLEE